MAKTTIVIEDGKVQISGDGAELIACVEEVELINLEMTKEEATVLFTLTEFVGGGQCAGEPRRAITAIRERMRQAGISHDKANILVEGSCYLHKRYKD